MAAKPKDDAATAEKPKSKMMLIVIILAVVAGLGGAGAFFMLTGGGEGEEGRRARRGRNRAWRCPCSKPPRFGRCAAGATQVATPQRSETTGQPLPWAWARRVSSGSTATGSVTRPISGRSLCESL